MHTHVIWAVFKRDFFSYFRSPAGYVFITLFILLGSVAAFWQERFFTHNLATLETLNSVFPYLLLFFIPAVTMGAWAPEKARGTEELLLTLPATDRDIVIGKYLACLGIYSVSLAFSLSHVVVLEWLGRPDFGLMAASYLGYWLQGAMLIGVGMIGSLMTDNLTVGFILGAMWCGMAVFSHDLTMVVPEQAARMLRHVTSVPLFGQLSRGVISLDLLVHVAGWLAFSAYVMQTLLGRRGWRQGRQEYQGVHRTVRAFALLVVTFSATSLAGRVPIRLDLTAEHLHSVSEETKALLKQLDPNNPVYVQAFVSRDVSQEYVQVRAALLELLQAYDARGGDAVVVNVRETERYTPEARDAMEQFAIGPVPVTSTRAGRSATDDVFLGVAFTCGPQEVVIPFLHKGISVEYELTRSIRVVSRPVRRKVGIVTTDAKLQGGFDFSSMASTRKWSIVEELEKQYDVVRVDPDGADLPHDLNVLLVGMPSSLNQDQMSRVSTWIRGGVPALLFDDPVPLTDLSISPGEQKGPRQQMLMGGSQPPPIPKGDAMGFYRALGISWSLHDVVWDSYNPHPQLAHLPQEVVFVGAKSGAEQPFHPTDPLSAGLQEVVALFPGHLAPVKQSPFTFVPLMHSTKKSGVMSVDQVVRRGFFGITGLNPRRNYASDNIAHVLAARVGGSPGKGKPDIHVIVVADLDLISEEFFGIRREGIANLEFDNVTFVLNAVDVLSGDESFVSLRKRRRQHRTLEVVEAKTRSHLEKSLDVTKGAEEQAKQRLKEAEDQLQQKIRVLEQRRDVDDQTKAIMVESLQNVENRRLEVTRANIEDDKQRVIQESKMGMEQSIRAIQQDITWSAVSLPPIPPLLLALWVYLRHRRRQRELIPRERFISVTS